MLTSIQMAVLQILSWQSSGYLCSPNASAFISQGLENSEEIEEALIFLQTEKYVEFFVEEEHIDVIKVERDSKGEPILNLEDNTVKPILDNAGNIQIETITRFADSGWVITETGRAQVT